MAAGFMEMWKVQGSRGESIEDTSHIIVWYKSVLLLYLVRTNLYAPAIALQVRLGRLVLSCHTAPCICGNLGVSGIARPEERDGVLSWDVGMVAVPVLRDMPIPLRSALLN